MRSLLLVSLFLGLLISFKVNAHDNSVSKQEFGKLLNEHLIAMESVFVEARCNKDCSELNLYKFAPDYLIEFVLEGDEINEDRLDLVKRELIGHANFFSDTGPKLTFDPNNNRYRVVVELKKLNTSISPLRLGEQCRGHKIVRQNKFVDGKFTLVYMQKNNEAKPYVYEKDFIFISCIRRLIDFIFDRRERPYIPGETTTSKRFFSDAYYLALMRLRVHENPSLNLFKGYFLDEFYKAFLLRQESF